MNDQQIEQEIQAKGLTAPRITPDDIKANIVSEHYFTAAEGNYGAEVCRRETPSLGRQPLLLLTFCVLELRNGFTVTGESACASPENFDAEIGRKMARDNAVNKVWPLMGYELKQRLYVQQQALARYDVAANLQPHQLRVVVEAAELADKIKKLEAFCKTELYDGLPADECAYLDAQLDAMTVYHDVLLGRIVAFKQEAAQ